MLSTILSIGERKKASQPYWLANVAILNQHYGSRLKDINMPKKKPDWTTDTFALVFERKHFTGDGWWMRVFGPYKTRSRAKTQKDRMIREMLNDCYSLEYINETCKFTITRQWTEKENGLASTPES